MIRARNDDGDGGGGGDHRQSAAMRGLGYPGVLSITFFFFNSRQAHVCSPSLQIDIFK